MKKFVLLLLIVFLSSCAVTESADVTDYVTEDEIIEENSIADPEPDVFVEYDILVTAKVINIRSTPDTSSSDNIVDHAYMGERYTVLEQKNDDNYEWYRIGENQWIANDGTWCVSFAEENYPYILSDDEKEDLLLELDTGGWCYTPKEADVYYCLVFFEEKIPGSEYNIRLGGYMYDLSYAIRINENTYDFYVIPIQNGEYIDCSTGCIRLANMAKEVINAYESIESYGFDMIFIQNRNPITDEDLKYCYENEIHYRCTFQVSI